jgi:hypothetical protein
MARRRRGACTPLRRGHDCTTNSEEPALGKGHTLLRRDYDVVEDTDIDEPQGTDQAPGQSLVGAARLGHSRRVAMEKYDRRGVRFERPLDDDTGIDGGPVDRAVEKLLDGPHAEAVVEEQAAEHLVAPVTEHEAQVGAGVLGAAERHAGAVAVRQDR